MAEKIRLDDQKQTPLLDIMLTEESWKVDLQMCIGCARCLSVCPLRGHEGLDPRKLIHLVALGQEEEVINSDWIWKCTGCDRCTNICPMGFTMSSLITRARSLLPRDKVPGGSQETAENHLNKGNNMAIPEEEWLDTLDWMREELEDDIPDLVIPVDKKGAKYFFTINSKLPKYYPLQLQDIYKINHATGISWTIGSQWWEGTNYAMFSGDLGIWEATLRKQVEYVESLGCEVMAYTECGHGYYATLAGYKKFGIKPKFELIHVVNLYAQWLREGLVKVDKSKNTKRVTLHDPCNAGRKAIKLGGRDILDDSRYVISQVCEDFVEMWPNREHNICCSGGGGALISGFKNARMEYGLTKIDQVKHTGAELVCAPCVNCHDALEDLESKYKPGWKPLHLWALFAKAIVLK
jgi:Fe-S oxidoreductase